MNFGTWDFGRADQVSELGPSERYPIVLSGLRRSRGTEDFALPRVLVTSPGAPQPTGAINQVKGPREGAPAGVIRSTVDQQQRPLADTTRQTVEDDGPQHIGKLHFAAPERTGTEGAHARGVLGGCA